MSLLRTETLIAVLLVGSVTVIAVNELCPVEEQISVGDEWHLLGGDDAYLGGTSEAEWSEIDGGVRIDYHVKDACSSPYVTMSSVSYTHLTLPTNREV